MSEAIKEPAGPEGIIQMQGVNKWYGQFHVLKDINLNVRQGERIVLCGPSGSGKSTTIRCLNRLEEHQQGRIVVDGVELTNDLKQIEAIRSEVGMVFQHFNLFPHLTVLQNVIEAPMVVQGVPRDAAIARAEALLAKVGLAEKRHNYPARLSGGLKQRVAIARALAMEPEIMLFDEPTSALDPELTGEVLRTMRALADEHMTMLVVTHEMGFAREVAHTAVFMDQGRIVESGPAASLFADPQQPRTRSFLRSML